MKLSVVILTKNNQDTIEYAIKSSLFANEVLIIDSGSTDKTLEIAKKYGVKIIYQEWLGYSKQKQFGVNLAKNDWVFVLDSDEEITKELQAEIVDVLKKTKFQGYYIKRRNIYFGKELKFGLYPDAHIRLFNRQFGKFNNRDVHESVIVNGKVGRLKSCFLHRAYANIEDCIEAFNRYSTLGAKGNNFKAIFSANWTFFKIYFLKLGFLDGWHGYIVARLYREYTFWKYIKDKKATLSNTHQSR